jgi:hypothetical protein
MSALRPVAALFVRADGPYASLPGVDCWTAERDARRWPGGAPVVADPPSRLWGRFKHLAKASNPERERDSARWAVRQVQRWGGVLVHPEGSGLWNDMGLAPPARISGTVIRDAAGGWTLAAPQFWWGAEAEKRTWFYIVGVEPLYIDLPFTLGEAPKMVGSRVRRVDGSLKEKRPEISKRARELTPPALAAWLVDLARRSKPPESQTETGKRD